MTDTNKLKELAELMRGWPNKECWPGEGEEDGLWFVGSLNEDDQTYPVLTIDTAQWDAEHDSKPMAEYYAAANPQAILGLIADLEEARHGMKYSHILRLKNELDRLKAENEALRKDAERYRWLRDDGYLDNWVDAHVCDEHLRPERTDAAIDAALEGGGR